jgi:hypothetical protein
MAKELEVAVDDLMMAFSQLKESILYERQITNSRLDYIEAETMKTKGMVKSAAQMIIENL